LTACAACERVADSHWLSFTCALSSDILKRAKLKANAEKAEALESKRRLRALERQEKERVDREQAKERSNSEAGEDESEPKPETAPTTSVLAKRNSLDDGLAPSSSPSADDFFPALIYTLIHARPPHLYLNLVYISLCRYESKLTGGEAAYWYTNLASAIQFLESVGEKSFSFVMSTSRTTSAAGKKEYDELMAAGQRRWDEEKVREEQEAAAAEAAKAEEARRKAEEAVSEEVNANVKVAATASTTSDDGPSAQPSPDASAALSSLPSSPLPPPPGLVHNHGASSWTVSSSSGSSGSINVAPNPLPPPCLACLHLSHRRVPTNFLDREFSTLTIAELQDVLREYKELCFVLQGWQQTPSHVEMKSMPLPSKHAYSGDDGEGVALTGNDANSAAPSNAAVAASSTATNMNASNAPAAASVSRGWPLTGFLGLGRSTK
jgi:hypothetical protein